MKALSAAADRLARLLALEAFELAGQEGFELVRSATERFEESRRMVGNCDGLRPRGSGLDHAARVVAGRAASTFVAQVDFDPREPALEP